MTIKPRWRSMVFIRFVFELLRKLVVAGNDRRVCVQEAERVGLLRSSEEAPQGLKGCLLVRILEDIICHGCLRRRGARAVLQRCQRGAPSPLVVWKVMSCVRVFGCVIRYFVCVYDVIIWCFVSVSLLTQQIKIFKCQLGYICVWHFKVPRKTQFEKY